MVKVGEMNVSINVAWMVFPVNCVAMGFLRYGQRYISLYHFGVVSFFCTFCDDVGYRQRDVCFYNIDMNTAAATHCADMGHLVYMDKAMYARLYNVDVKTASSARCMGMSSL